ncbi:hypothetical protein EJB05_39066, partial [Eragrostis curvula]
MSGSAVVDDGAASNNPALAPDTDAPGGEGLALAQFAAGCFWGVELTFQRVPGVARTEVGYTQGHLHEPTYKVVCGDGTGHAEVVRVHYDVFCAKHNPTTLNSTSFISGNEVGTQYRSGIYYYTAEQEAQARESLAEQQKKWEDKIVTEILPAKRFYHAEEYHQRYLEKGGQSAEKGCADPIRCYG